MIGMLLAERTVLLGLHSFRMQLLLLHSVVVTLLAFGTCQSNSNAHCVHLQLTIFSCCFYHLRHKKKNLGPFIRSNNIPYPLQSVKGFFQKSQDFSRFFGGFGRIFCIFLEPFFEVPVPLQIWHFWQMKTGENLVFLKNAGLLSSIFPSNFCNFFAIKIFMAFSALFLMRSDEIPAYSMLKFRYADFLKIWYTQNRNFACTNSSFFLPSEKSTCFQADSAVFPSLFSTRSPKFFL